MLLLVMQGFTVWLTTFGFDLTDEASYVNSILWSSHYGYSWGGSDAGRLYGYMLAIFNNDFGVLRMFTQVVNWVLIVIFALLLRRRLVPESGSVWRIETLLWVLVLATLASLAQRIWLPTPSYNTLAWQGVMIFAIATLVSVDSRILRSITFSFSIAVSFLAKAPVGLALLVLLLVMVLPLGRKGVTQLAISGGAFGFLLWIWATLTRGGLVEYFQSLYLSFTQISNLQAGQIWAADSLLSRVLISMSPFSAANPWPALTFLAGTLALGSLLLLSSSEVKVQKRLVFVGLSVVIVSGSIFLTVFVFPEGNLGQLTLIGLGGVIVAWLWFLFSRDKGGFSPLRAGINVTNDLKQAAVFLVLPLVYASGTNNNYVQQASALGVLFFAASLLLAKALILGRIPNEGRRIQLLHIQASVGMLVALTSLLWASINPYRQQIPVFEMVSSNVIQGIHVAPEFDVYMAKLAEIREGTSFPSGTPVIDNSGNSPGAVFAMSGLPIGSTWLIGGYEGSVEVAKSQLARYSIRCLENALIIDEPLGDRRLFEIEDSELPVLKPRDLVTIGRLINPLTGNQQVVYVSRRAVPIGSGECQQIKP